MEKDYADELEERFVIMYANKYTYDELNQIKDNLLKMNKDTSIIDKSIQLKLKNKHIKEKEEQEFNKRLKSVRRHAFLSGLFGGLTSGKKMNNDLSSWEYQEMLNNELEESNFEEEIEDEDDFYSDDLD